LFLAKENPSQQDSLIDGTKKSTDQILTGSSLEAKSLFKSPYFSKSYDYPYNPDPLVRGNTYSIYEEMRQDEQIKVTLSLKKDFAIGTGWQIECKNKIVKEFIENSLKNINESMAMDTTFEDILRDMLSSYDYGFSLSEPVWEIRDFNGKPMYWYKTIKTRPPHGFLIYPDKFGNIEKIQQNTDIGTLDFDPRIFLHHVYQQEFGNPFGQSDLFSAHPSWKAKKFVSRFMNIYLERFASPTVVGKYKAGLTPQEISRFHSMLETVQQNTAITIPAETAIDFIQSARDGTDAYIKSLDYFNLQIQRSVLVPDLLGIGGSKTEGGSYALGEKHFDIFIATVEKDRKSLSRKLTMKIVRPLVMANFGDIPCEFKFLPFTDDKIGEFLKIWIQAVNGKAFKPNPDEINYFRKTTGFPEGPVVDVEFPKPFFQEGSVPPNKKQNEEMSNGKKENEENTETKENSLKNNGVLLFREMTTYESKTDFKELKRILDSSENSVSPRLEKSGIDIINDFVDQVREKGVIRRGAVESLSSITPHFQGPMKSVFKSYFRDLFNLSARQAREEFFRGSRNLASEDFLPEEIMNLFDQESFKIVGDYSAEITKRGRNIILQGIKDGLSESEIVRLAKDSMKEVSEKWLSTVVRTKTTEVMNDARKSYWENDEIASQIVEAYQFSAIIDNRTSEVCSSLDGKIFERGEFIDRITPPLHFNCRSLLVPITRYEQYEKDKAPSLESLKKIGGNLIVA